MFVLLGTIESDEDRRLFAKIYDQHNQTALFVARKYFPHDQQSAEDAVQNAWLQVIKHFKKVYQIPCDKLAFWIISIVKNEALMLLRKGRKYVPIEDWDAVTEGADHILDYQDLVALFCKLPETYRATLEMRFLLQYTNQEIAQHLGLTETAVGARINRGRKLLKEILEKEGWDQ